MACKTQRDILFATSENRLHIKQMHFKYLQHLKMNEKKKQEECA